MVFLMSKLHLVLLQDCLVNIFDENNVYDEMNLKRTTRF